MKGKLKSVTFRNLALVNEGINFEPVKDWNPDLMITNSIQTEVTECYEVSWAVIYWTICIACTLHITP
jgi:hypothetical protein